MFCIISFSNKNITYSLIKKVGFLKPCHFFWSGPHLAMQSFFVENFVITTIRELLI